MQCHTCHAYLPIKSSVGSLVKKIDQDGNTLFICHQCNDVYDFFTTQSTQKTIKEPVDVHVPVGVGVDVDVDVAVDKNKAAKQGIACLNCKAIIVGKHCSCGAINPLSRPRKKRT